MLTKATVGSSRATRMQFAVCMQLPAFNDVLQLDKTGRVGRAWQGANSGGQRRNINRNSTAHTAGIWVSS